MPTPSSLPSTPSKLRSLFLSLALLILATSFAWAGSYTFQTNTHTQYTGNGEIPADFTHSHPGTTLRGLSPNIDDTPFATTPSIDEIFYGAIPHTHLFGIQAFDHSVNVLTLNTFASTFTDIAGDIYGVYAGHDAVDFFLDTNEGDFHFVEDLVDTSHNRNGHNFFSIEATGDLVINSLTIGDINKYNFDHSHPGSHTDAKFYSLNVLAMSGFDPGENGNGQLLFDGLLFDGQPLDLRADLLAPVPEPSSLLLLGSGLLTAAGLFRKKLSL